MGFDVNCFTGNWPFFSVRENTVEKLQNLHSKYKISGGFISSLEAIFYQDPYEAEMQLAQQIDGTAYEQIMVLNPLLPGWKNDLENCINRLGIGGVRLMPGFHGYSLKDKSVDEAVSFAAKNSLHFMITLRMQDDRAVWMHHPQCVPMEELAEFLNQNGDLPVVLNHIYPYEIDRLNDLDVNWENVYVDTSGFKGGDNPLESVLSKKFLKGHIVFGSGAPLMEPYATVFQLETADIVEGERNQIFNCENYLSAK